VFGASEDTGVGDKENRQFELVAAYDGRSELGQQMVVNICP